MRRTSSPNRPTDVYQTITDHIVAAIEAGVGQVEMPWYRSGVPLTRPLNVFTGNPYRGVNILSLWTTSLTHAYASGFWGTYKQWRGLGAHVRKGEKGTIIVFYKRFEPVDTSGGRIPAAHQNSDAVRQEPEPEGHDRTVRWFARASWVFNADQVEGWEIPKPVVRDPVEVIADAEAFIVRTRADLRHGGEVACYHLIPDYIDMPDLERFTGTETSTATESYYAVLLHELTHWTGHPSRLARQLLSRFGDSAYAMEELIAELGATFLCADLAITSTPRPDHAGYISEWLSVFKDDKRAIFTAASKASEAADFLTALQSKDNAAPRQSHVGAGA